MGMAYRSPKSVYQRSYYIATHVVDRLRERNADSDLIEDGVIYRSRIDLMNRIDAAIKDAVAAGQVEHLWDRGEPGRLVAIRDWFDDDSCIYILLKRDAKNERGWAAVTVLTETQVETSKDSNRWEFTNTPHPEVLPSLSNKPRVTPKGFAPVPVPPAVQERRLPIAVDEMILFYYKTKDGNDHYERCLYRDATQCGIKIVNDPNYQDGSLESYSRLRSELRLNKRPIDF